MRVVALLATLLASAGALQLASPSLPTAAMASRPAVAPLMLAKSKKAKASKAAKSEVSPAPPQHTLHGPPAQTIRRDSFASFSGGRCA